ncbi:MAG: hypothetical protein ACRDRO_30165 [Pseudonocardiaceae bacterium]
MTFFLHKASGALPSGQPWSIGLVSSGSVSEASAETTWGGAINAFFTTAGVDALYSTLTTMTATSTSTASATFKQTTITRTVHTAAGTDAANPELPDHDSLVTTFYTPAATKSGHGRWYLPGLTAGSLGIGGHGVWKSASLTTIATALGTWKTSMATGGLSPLLLTRKATLGGLAANTTQLITAAELSNKVAVQTRRGDKIPPVRTVIAW